MSDSDGWGDVPLILGYSGRVLDPQRRQGEGQFLAEYMSMMKIGQVLGAREALHTGQGSRIGNPWDFELFFEGGRRDLGEHVLYTDVDEGPDKAVLQTGVVTGWDPDADFRKMLSSPAVKKHVWRVSAWRSDSSLQFAKSHLVVEPHSLVPSVDFFEALVPEAVPSTPATPSAQQLTARSGLTYGEVGEVDFIWVFSDRTPNGLVWTQQTWFPLRMPSVGE